MKALGMIETYGLVGAIEAADVMLKVADVSLIKAEKVQGGLVNVFITGDVAAVKTAVDAGVGAVKDLGEACFYNSHVIPRPDHQVVSLYEEDHEEDERGVTNPPVFMEPIKTPEEIEQEPLQTVLESPVEMTEMSKESQAPTVKSEEVSLTPKDYKKRLEKMKAADLRKLLLHHPKLTLTEETVQGMVRRKMIAILMEELEKRGEN